MDLKTLRETPPWDWPEGIGKRLGDILRDREADGGQRLLAAELAGDFTVIDDTLVGTLLSILRRADESESLRRRVGERERGRSLRGRLLGRRLVRGGGLVSRRLPRHRRGH